MLGNAMAFVGELGVASADLSKTKVPFTAMLATGNTNASAGAFLPGFLHSDIAADRFADFSALPEGTFYDHFHSSYGESAGRKGEAAFSRLGVTYIRDCWQRYGRCHF